MTNKTFVSVPVTEKIRQFLGTKVIYDNDGQKIFANNNGDLQMLADLRGWGAIQNLFKNKGGQVDFEKAAKFQDELGEFVANAITSALLEQSTPSIEGKSKGEILNNCRSVRGAAGYDPAYWDAALMAMDEYAKQEVDRVVSSPLTPLVNISDDGLKELYNIAYNDGFEGKADVILATELIQDAVNKIKKEYGSTPLVPTDEEIKQRANKLEASTSWCHGYSYEQGQNDMRDLWLNKGKSKQEGETK